MKKISLSLALTLMCFSAIRAETLQSAINYAWANSEDIKVLNKQKTDLKIDRFTAYSKYLPSASVSYNRNEITAIRSNVDISSFENFIKFGSFIQRSLTVNQNLSFHKAITEALGAQSAFNAASVAIDAKKQEILLSVANNYLSVLFLQSKVENLQTKIDYLTKFLEISQARNSAGIIDEAQLLTSQSELVSAQSELMIAESDLQEARARYLRIANKEVEDFSDRGLDEIKLSYSTEEDFIQAVMQCIGSFLHQLYHHMNPMPFMRLYRWICLIPIKLLAIARDL
jgi:outer membrane protein TolC